MKRLEKIIGKSEFKTLDDIVKSWTKEFGAKGKHKHMRDEVVELCAMQTTVQKAVLMAVLSYRPNGKVHHHQSRVPLAKRTAFGDEFLRNMSKGRWKPKAKYKWPLTFDELYDQLEAAAKVVGGIGPVTTYDVATRIAAKLELPIESLYLHAGVLEGWKRLGLPHKQLRIPKEQLPKALRKLPTDEVEDMLCAYREKLHPGLIQ